MAIGVPNLMPGQRPSAGGFGGITAAGVNAASDTVSRIRGPNAPTAGNPFGEEMVRSGSTGAYGSVTQLPQQQYISGQYLDPASWMLGREPEYAKNMANTMEAVGRNSAQGMWGLGANAINQGAAAGAQMNALGSGGMFDMASLGARQSALGQAGMRDMATLGMQGIGLGAQAQAQIGGFGQQLDARGQAAAARATPMTDYGMAGATQGNVLGRANQLAGLEAVQGPSAAQAQLQAGLNAAQASNLAMARSGRGWGGNAAAMAQAQGLNAAAAQQAANQSALIRAQEDAAWRQRQAANLATAGQLGTGIAGQQVGQAQFLTQADLQSRQINDAAQLAMQQQALQGMTSGAQLGLQGQQMGIDAYGRGLDYGMQGELNYANTYGQGLNYGMQGAQNANQAALAGMTLGGQLGQAAYSMEMGGLGAASDIWRTQAQMDMAREQNVTQRYGIESGVGIQNNATNLGLLGAGLTAGGVLIGGAFGGPGGAAAGGAAGAAGGQAIQRI